MTRSTTNVSNYPLAHCRTPGCDGRMIDGARHECGFCRSGKEPHGWSRREIRRVVLPLAPVERRAA